MEVYRLEEIAKALGLSSPNAARNRVKAIGDVLDDKGWRVYLPDEGNALAVTPEGLNLLHQLQDRINAGATMQAAAQAIKVDLGLAEPPPDPHRVRKIEVRLGQVERDLNELRDQLTKVKRPWWARVLRLPPPEE